MFRYALTKIDDTSISKNIFKLKIKLGIFHTEIISVMYTVVKLHQKQFATCY